MDWNDGTPLLCGSADVHREAKKGVDQKHYIAKLILRHSPDFHLFADAVDVAASKPTILVTGDFQCDGDSLCKVGLFHARTPQSTP